MNAPLQALAGLELEVARQQRYLGDLPEEWVPERPGVDHDVLVVGGGQSGVATAYGLRRAGITRVLVIDGAQEAGVGAWQTKARMHMLRTAKRNTGPDLGLPALTFRAWYEAQHGEAAYDAIVRVATRDWVDYLGWVRRVLRVPVQYGTRLLRIEPVPAQGSASGLFRVHLEQQGQPLTRVVRKVVLATGAVGAGIPNLPPTLAALPPHLVAHTDERIDFVALAGRRVVVVGGASSAFDAAGAALEAGAASVRLLVRADDLVRVSTGKQAGYAGAAAHFVHLPDAVRWRLGRHLRSRSPGPMAETVRRATAFGNFGIRLLADVTAAEPAGQGARLRVGDEWIEADFVIAATGYRVDPALRPELGALAPHIAVWADRLAPHEAEGAAAARSPYLGAGYEFIERTPGSAPFLKHVHCFNYAAMTSHGRHVGDVSSLAAGVPALVAAIGRDLFLDDEQAHVARITGPASVELTGGEYAQAVERAPGP